MEDLWNHYFSSRIESALNNKDCPSFGDYEQRIKFILKMGDSEQIGKFISNVPVVEKNAKESCEFRVKGNDFFTCKEGSKMDKAIEEYTKSVAHAPTGSQELALAYANRSAVLFKARLISDCLLDIGRALQNNYPDNMKAKLYLRKAICLQTLKSEKDPSIKTAFAKARKWAEKMDEKNKKIMEKMLVKQKEVTSIDKSTFPKWDGKKFLPKLSAENPMIPGLSDAVEMQYSKKYGRHMVATRDIKPGEVIFLEKVYFAVVHVKSRYILCWNCGEQTWASIPCEKCVEVVFCSEICRDEAMSEHHDIECPVIASLIALNWSDAVLMPLRLIVKGLKEMDNSFEAWRRCIQKIDSDKNLLLKGFTNNILEPNKFSSIYGLSAHVDKKTQFTQLEISSSIFVSFLLAIKTSYFGSRIDDDFETFSSKKNFIFVIGLFERLMKLSQSKFNGTHVRDTGCCVISPAWSFFNHSCNSMVICTDHDDYMAGRVSRPIKKGQQIFYSYGPNYVMIPRNERQAYLSSVYNFLCDCEACENDWQHGILGKFEKQSGEKINPLSIEANLLFCDSLGKCTAIRESKNYNFNIEKDVARVAKALEKFYRFNRPPNSFEISSTQYALNFLLDLTKNRLLSLD